MKRFPGKQFVAWFGYTRREQRASSILLILIVIVGGVRYAVPQSDMEIRIIPEDSPLQETAFPSAERVDSPEIMIRPTVRKSPPSRVLELNTCDSAELESLPAIGPVLAARIIKYRNLLGGYAFTEQLKEVYGLTPEAYSTISSRVSADTSLIKKININRKISLTL